MGVQIRVSSIFSRFVITFDTLHVHVSTLQVNYDDIRLNIIWIQYFNTIFNNIERIQYVLAVITPVIATIILFSHQIKRP